MDNTVRMNNGHGCHGAATRIFIKLLSVFIRPSGGRVYRDAWMAKSGRRSSAVNVFLFYYLLLFYGGTTMDINLNINLNVDNRIIKISRKLFSKRGALVFMTSFLIMSTIMLQGSQITKPYADFQEGDTIDPVAVNDNFDDLFSESNAQDTRITALESKSWDKSGNDLVYNSGNIQIGAGYSLKDRYGLTVNGYITTGVGGFPSDSAIKLKVLKIGDWNMNTSNGKFVTHGLTYGNIINVWAIIRNDGDSIRHMLVSSSPGAIASESLVYYDFAYIYIFTSRNRWFI